MGTKILHIKLLVTVPEKPPQELIEAYIKGCMESPDKGYKRLKEVLPNVEAVIEKIIKPSIKGSKRFLNPEAVTRVGTKIKDIPPPTLAEMKRRARKYLKRMEYAFRHGGKEYAEIVKVMAGYWAKTMLSTLAITGYQDKIRGVGPIVAEWLTGILTVVPPEDGSGANFRVASGDKRINREEIIEGKPIDITKRGQGGKFRKRFNSQILSVGKPIIAKNYLPSDIIYANEQINQLINDYARDEFVPFTPGGDSHVDFMMVDGELFLDVQVAASE